jgi:hypothetical protein
VTARASNKLFLWFRLRHPFGSRLLNDSMQPLSPQAAGVPIEVVSAHAR